jgi:hypothetical protein
LSAAVLVFANLGNGKREIGGRAVHLVMTHKQFYFAGYQGLPSMAVPVG